MTPLFPLNFSLYFFLLAVYFCLDAHLALKHHFGWNTLTVFLLLNFCLLLNSPFLFIEQLSSLSLDFRASELTFTSVSFSCYVAHQLLVLWPCYYCVILESRDMVPAFCFQFYSQHYRRILSFLLA